MRNHLCKTILKKSKKVYCGAPHLVHQRSWENVGTSLEWGIENQPLSKLHIPPSNVAAYKMRLVLKHLIYSVTKKLNHFINSATRCLNHFEWALEIPATVTSPTHYFESGKIGVKYPYFIGQSAKYSVIKYSKLWMERTKTMGKNSC